MDAEALRRFRAMKDEFFATDPSSPLTLRQRARFAGLAYFAPNPDLVVKAEIRAYVAPSDIDLVTSCSDTERYRRAGVVWFEVAGIPAPVTLYRSGRGELFVPFRDATSGIETYSAGRYLEAPVREMVARSSTSTTPTTPTARTARGGGARSRRSRTTSPSRSAPARCAIGTRTQRRPRTRMKPGIVAHLRRPSRARG